MLCKQRRQKRLLWATLSVHILAVAYSMPTATAQMPPTAVERAPGILNDYIYGFVPVIMEATRDMATAVPDNLTPGRAPINQFAYSNTLVTPQTQTIVRSEADTLYSTAWLDVGCEPMILHVPDSAGRFYLLPMLDAYSNVFASIGSRTTGDGAGDYVIMGPDWNGPLPQKVSGTIKAPTNTVWLLGRTLVRGPADLQSAAAIASQFLLIPLSAYPQYLLTGSYSPPTGLPVTPPNPNFDSHPLLSSPGFSTPEFFDFLLPYALVNPPPAAQLREATAYVLDGFIEQSQMSSAVTARAIEQAAALSTGPQENGWSVNFNIGSYGSNYLLRDTTALFGFGANAPADAVYLNAHADIDGTSLTGAHSYVVHFAPGQMPPAHGFWSLTVYDSQGFLIPNPLNRYDVGSETGLVTNPDGSVDILLGASDPGTLPNNWLPVPAGPFNLTLRVYWPDQTVLSGAWMPPPITVASAPLP